MTHIHRKCRQLAQMLCDQRNIPRPAAWQYEDYEDGGCSVSFSPVKDLMMVKVEPDGSWAVYETILVDGWWNQITVLKKTFDAFI